MVLHKYSVQNTMTGLTRLMLVASVAVVFSCTAKKADSSRSLEFMYTVSVQSIPEKTERVDLWIPIPQSNQFQQIVDLTIDAQYPFSFHTDPEYGNRMVYLNVEKGIPQQLDLTLRFIARRTAYSVWENVPVSELKSDELQRFLQRDSLVPIDGKIAEEASLAVSDASGTMQKARALYEHLIETMEYDKTGSGWGRGDALYACDVRRGNCTDFHSLFIGMARSLGIPARFAIGFPLPPDTDKGTISGYHCWAEFYLPDRGWVPVDISEAHKHPEKKKFLFGGLDAYRIEFTRGRDIQLSPRASDVRLNYFIYPHVLVDGHEYHNVKKEFSFNSIKEK